MNVIPAEKWNEAMACQTAYNTGLLSLHQAMTALEFLELAYLFELTEGAALLVRKHFPSIDPMCCRGELS